jgi:hypothetical protein
MFKRLFIIIILIALNIILGVEMLSYRKHYLNIDGLYKNSLYDISIDFLGKNYFDYNALKVNEHYFLEELPLFSIANFDCVTFVETVLAIHISNNFNNFLENIKKIRYKDANMDFFNRNHFMTVDWEKNNSWLLENYTENYPVVKSKSIEVNKKNWIIAQHHALFEYLKNNDDLKKLDEFEVYNGDIKYISVDEVINNKDFYKNMPAESIVFIIKDFSKIKKDFGTELDVSHVGFLFRKKNELRKYFKFLDDEKLIFIHSSVIRGKITSQNFVTYITDMTEKSKNLEGIVILTLKKNYEK